MSIAENLNCDYSYENSSEIGELEYFNSALHSSLLKVPKREIFDRSDFPDFYTMKSLRVGDFGVKIK